MLEQTRLKIDYQILEAREPLNAEQFDQAVEATFLIFSAC